MNRDIFIKRYGKQWYEDHRWLGQHVIRTTDYSAQVISALGTAANKFVVLDSSGALKYRTNTEVLSDIEAVPLNLSADTTIDANGFRLSVTDADWFDFLTETDGVTNRNSQFFADKDQAYIYSGANPAGFSRITWTYQNIISLVSAGGTSSTLTQTTTGLTFTGVSNGTGDFVTITAGGLFQRRTAAQTLSDIGAFPSGSVSGAANRVAYFTGASAIGSSAKMTFDGSTLSSTDRISSGEFVLGSGGRLYTDGVAGAGGDSYFSEPTSNTIQATCGNGSGNFRVNASQLQIGVGSASIHYLNFRNNVSTEGYVTYDSTLMELWTANISRLKIGGATYTGIDVIGPSRMQNQVTFLAGIRNAFLSTYADNAAASAGGLSTGDFYKTATGQVMVVY